MGLFDAKEAEDDSKPEAVDPACVAAAKALREALQDEDDEGVARALCTLIDNYQPGEPDADDMGGKKPVMVLSVSHGK